MIFLGAGASKVFGLKTMQDLTKDIIDEMKERGYGKTIADILSAFEKFGISPDFENIYTTLEALANPKDGIRKSGAFAAYIAHKGNFEISKSFPEYIDILVDFRKLIHAECTIRKGTIETKGGVFDKLFNVTREYYEERFLSSRIGESGLRKVDVGNTIVTTNYDMAVELHQRWTGIEFADGFKSTRKEYIKEFDLQEYGRNATSRWLIKLHGSIWQFDQEGKIIQTMSSPSDLPLIISVGEQMMIYPVGEKPILREPFYSFYSIFREQPWNILIAIGYSFRDEPINAAVLERLSVRPPPKTKLIVVDPDADKTVLNLGTSVTKLDQRIIRINAPFEDDVKLFDRISIALDSRTSDDFQQRLQSL